MRTQEELPVEEQKKEFAERLNKLLADEYVLMNKTSTCLFKSSSPAFQKVPQIVYEELKKNVQEILAMLKRKKLNALISINDILSNTRLNNNIDFSSKASLFSILINDHSSIANNIDKDLSKGKAGSDLELRKLFETIKKRHQLIEEKLNDYFTWAFKTYTRKSA
ncbi:MAG: hypothetical protein JWQ96_3102 [Segetibacter sp.]|nr:hypothetical protein [Segetibacter sp.]